MAEEPYDDLDIGYIEYPMPNTEEFALVRLLTKNGLARLWQKIKDKFIKKPDGGTAGQLLSKTLYGEEWIDPPVSLPDGGTAGQLLSKTEEGAVWIDIDIPEIVHASDIDYGTVKFYNDSDFCTAIGIPYDENAWPEDSSDIYIPCSLRQIKALLNTDIDFVNNYTKIQYIQSNGTQYIDTGIKATGSMTVGGVLENLDKSTNAKCLFGADNAWLDCDIGMWMTNFAYGNQSSNQKLNSGKHDYRFESNKAYTDSTLIYTFEKQTFTSNSSITICAHNRNGTLQEYSSTRIYSFKIIQENGVQLRDFVPCINKINNVPGLYDKITKTFYSSPTDTDFVAGPAI